LPPPFLGKSYAMSSSRSRSPMDGSGTSQARLLPPRRRRKGPSGALTSLRGCGVGVAFIVDLAGAPGIRITVRRIRPLRPSSPPFQQIQIWRPVLPPAAARSETNAPKQTDPRGAGEDTNVRRSAPLHRTSPESPVGNDSRRGSRTGAPPVSPQSLCDIRVTGKVRVSVKVALIHQQVANASLVSPGPSRTLPEKLCFRSFAPLEICSAADEWPTGRTANGVLRFSIRRQTRKFIAAQSVTLKQNPSRTEQSFRNYCCGVGLTLLNSHFAAEPRKGRAAFVADSLPDGFALLTPLSLGGRATPRQLLQLALNRRGGRRVNTAGAVLLVPGGRAPVPGWGAGSGSKEGSKGTPHSRPKAGTKAWTLPEPLLPLQFLVGLHHSPCKVCAVARTARKPANCRGICAGRRAGGTGLCHRSSR